LQKARNCLGLNEGTTRKKPYFLLIEVATGFEGTRFYLSPRVSTNRLA
jgi:hypothetical protein